MAKKPTYEELEQRIKGLEKEAVEHKHLEEALRESEAELFTIYNNSPIIMFLVDEDHRVLKANQLALESTDRQYDEIVGLRGGEALRCVHAADPAGCGFGVQCEECIVRNTVLDSLRTGNAHHNIEAPVQLDLGDGVIDLWLLVSTSPLNVAGKKSVLVCLVNITERKRAEKTLRASAQEWKTTFNSISDAICLLNKEGEILQCNEAMANLLGKPANEIKGGTCWELIHGTSKPIEGCPVERMKETCQRETLILPTGDRMLQVSTDPVLDEDGNVTTAVHIISDITERKRAEEALRDSEKRYKALFESAGDGIYVHDFDNQIIDSNQAHCDLLGYTREEFLQMKLTDFISPENAALLPERFKILQDLGHKVFESTHIRRDGARLPVEANSRVIEYKGKPAVLTIIRDISERKRMEDEQKKLQAQLQRAQKMEAIGVLAGGVAHDLNNILGGLVSYPDLLLLEIPEDSPLRNPILTIQKSGQRAATIVEDLLTLPRRGVAVTEVVNLNDIISEYLKNPEHERLISFHAGVNVRTDLEGDLLNTLGSPAHLSKTIMNLVSNAAEAMPEGGEISISTENQYIDRPVTGYDHVEEGDYSVLRVSDTGVGISKMDRERIFEPFYTKKVMGRSGTGLGMTVVWGTVKDHEGYIDIKSTKGKGTTFTLYFPVTRKELPKDKALLSIEDYMAKGESVLVIDDVKEQREIASKILKKLGYSVTSVSSGEEAVDYLKDNSADLLVLDMIMDPGIDGLETYKRILEFHPNQKAIIVSGFSETKRVKEAQRLGAGAYVKKPFLLRKIGLAVREELFR